MRKKYFITVFATLLFVAVIRIVSAQVNGRTPQLNPLQQKLYDNRFGIALQPAPAPDFSLPLLDSTEEFSLAAQRGKVVIINFWATWCPPCREEMPALERLYQRYRRNDSVEIVTIAETNSQTLADIRAFINAGGYNFPVLIDTESLAFYNYQAESIPTTVIIDRNGNYLAQMVGYYEWDSPIFFEALDEILEIEMGTVW